MDGCDGRNTYGSINVFPLFEKCEHGSELEWFLDKKVAVSRSGLGKPNSTLRANVRVQVSVPHCIGLIV